jgi:hypothetical protein
MSDPARDEFIRATYVLSKRDPQAWVEFRDAFTAYTAYELERAAGTPIGEALTALGHARCLVQLRNDFRDIEGLAAKIKVVR